MVHSHHRLGRHTRRLVGQRPACLRLFPLLAVALTVLGLAAPAARAATRTVTNTKDSGAGSLRAVIAAAAAGDTVTFTVTGTIKLTSGQITLTQPVTLQGPGAGSLAIDGNKSSRIFEASASSGTVTLNNLTLQNGYLYNDYGAGLENDGNGAALVLTGCTISGCFNDYSGIGGGLYSSGGLMTLTGCLFTGNVAGAGGGVEADGSSGRATVTGCVFTGNSAGAGGGYYNSRGQSTLTNCVFTGNSASAYSGGFFSNTATSTLTGCSFTGNTGGSYGGALGSLNSTTTLTDDIFYGNSASSSPEIWLSSGATATVTYCDVQGGQAGTGNFSADPAFVSGTAPYDLQVRPGSPVVAAGVAVPGLTTDITGAIRADPPTVGAYEGTQAGTQTQIALANGSSATIPSGGSASFTVTVANTSSPGGPIPSGSVQLRVKGSPVGSTVALAGGSATLSLTFPQAGIYTVSAAYTPAAGNFTASTSGSLTETVVGTPTANAQSVSVPFNTATPIALTGSDPNSPPRALTYTVTSSPAHGTVSALRVATGGVTYTPTAGYHGADSFTFTVNNGTYTSSLATVTLNVAAGVPTANAQTASVAFNTAKAITLTGTDPDVPVLTLTYTVTASPTHGTLSGLNPATGAVTYTPTAGYTGNDSFTFTVSNGTHTSAPATVSVTVNPVFLTALTFPTPVEGGSVFNGTVTLSGITPVDVVVGLSSSNSATIRIHRSVIVPAGSSSATFEIDTYRSHVTQTVTVQAVLNQVTLTKDLTITGR